MNSKEIIEYIKEPGALQKKQKDELQRLIQQYAYCSTLHYLWLKSLKNTGNTSLDNSIKYSSMFIHDRRYFYDWFIQEHQAKHAEKQNSEKKKSTSGPNLTKNEQEEHMQNRLRQIEKEKDYQELDQKEKNTDTENTRLDELINKFLNNEPKIVPDDSKDFSTEDQQASRSVEEDNELVSETLAKVYERQGKINKAKEIYEKLSLKFPEKKRYFAALIKKLENKTNEE